MVSLMYSESANPSFTPWFEDKHFENITSAMAKVAGTDLRKAEEAAQQDP